MKIFNDFTLSQKHKLNLTPFLKESIEILKFSENDLNEFINKELFSNPILKRKNISSSNNKSSSAENFQSEYENYSKEGTSLLEHLENQVNLLKLDKITKKIIEFLIGNIDKNGYLDITMSEISSKFSNNKTEIQNSLKIIKNLEPTGVGAKDLQECLLIQLKAKNLENSLAYKIINLAIEDLAANRFQIISKKFNVDIVEIKKAKEIILTLNPTPGRTFSYITKLNLITPDVIVKFENNQYNISLNSKFLRNDLEIDTAYLNLDRALYSEEELEFIKSKIKRAENLIKSIEQRNKTLLDISSKILEYQLDFFKGGIYKLKKLTRKTIAEDLNIHPSTVSRAVSDKFLECPHGIFELKYFFPSGIKQSSEEISSSENLKFHIKKLIENENKKKPLSDEEIARELNKSQIKISRRCIAKYRNLLNIPSSSKRKEF